MPEKKPDVTIPDGMKAFLDDENWKDVDHPKSKKTIKVSSLPKVKTRIHEIALSILSESEDLSALHKHVRSEYQGVAADLPSWGHGHHDAAHDHAADNLHDHFHKTHPHVNFRKVVKQALKGYADDDRAETRKNEARERRQEAARNRPPKVKKTKESEPWWKKAGYSTPMSKPRKGIGSS